MAQKGIYKKRSLRDVDDTAVKRYFNKDSNRFILNADIKKMVNFTYHNLVNPVYPLPSTGLWDIIYCRNVLIYFKLDVVRKVISKMYDCLAEGGYLFIGYSESLYNISRDFTLVQIGDAFVYKKEPKYQTQSSRKPKDVSTAKPHQTQGSAVHHKRSDNLYEQAFELYLKEQYDHALKVINEFLKQKPRSTLGHLLAGRVCLEKEYLKRALNEFNIVIEHDSLIAQAYYYLGITYDKLNQINESIRHYKKALYADKNFAMAHFNLASLYHSHGDRTHALRYYKNALQCLKQVPSQQSLEYAGWLTAKAIVETCQRNIQKLQE
jgi:chemotaxis protein methyltransferase CheR